MSRQNFYRAEQRQRGFLLPMGAIPERYNLSQSKSVTVVLSLFLLTLWSEAGGLITV